MGPGHEAAEAWNARGAKADAERDAWLRKTFGCEVTAYAHVDGRIVAVAPKKRDETWEPEYQHRKYVREVDFEYRADDGTVKTIRAWVPNKRTKGGRSLAKDFDGFRKEGAEAVAKALSMTKTSWMVHDRGRPYFVGIGLRKIGEHWYLSMPTYGLSHEKPDVLAAEMLQLWQYMKIVEDSGLGPEFEVR